MQKNRYEKVFIGQSALFYKASPNNDNFDFCKQKVLLDFIL